MSECQFCKLVKRENKYWKKELGITHKVSLVSENHRKDGTFAGSTTHKPMDLNFCPVCGRTILYFDIVIKYQETKYTIDECVPSDINSELSAMGLEPIKKKLKRVKFGRRLTILDSGKWAIIEDGIIIFEGTEDECRGRI